MATNMEPKKAEKRDKIIRVYITESEEKSITQYSKEQQISRSDILRSLWLAFHKQREH